MLISFIGMHPVSFIISWVLQAIGYYMVLKKVGVKPLNALVPVVAEYQLSRRLFKRRRSFVRPAVICAILVCALLYVGNGQEMALGFKTAIFLIYGVFLFRLYWRLAKAFGKGKLFAFALIFIPAIFLIVLGKGKAQFTQPEFKPDKERTKTNRIVRRVIFVVISAIEVVVIVSGIAFVCILTVTPPVIVNYLLDDNYASTKDVTGTGELVTREDILGADAPAITEAKASREYFFPDHSGDQNVVVMTYIVGSNLEDGRGLASANIRQMIDATKQGEGLTFVIEAGGSKRWFTKGIENGTYGRYEISNGEIKKIEDLPDDTCMSDGKVLGDFISWAKGKYPADRNMLVLWDHGGGLTYGYGQDQINKGTGKFGTINVDDMVAALKKADMKFDTIGFDACLMQDIEVAKVLEPYADYYIASEEVEGGYGWFYTSAFGMLAKNPGVSTYDFAKELVACYDPYNFIIKEGKPDTTATLSFVDLTLASAAYDNLAQFFGEMATQVEASPAAYADIAIAANDTYAFDGNYQIDLVDFIQRLDDVDFDDSIYSHEDKEKLLQSIEASILFRNAATAKGANGMAFAFPYKTIGDYSDTTNQFKSLKLKDEKKAMDDIFSIMAAKRQKEAAKAKDKDKGHESLLAILNDVLDTTDYTKESWYVEGFENYGGDKVYVDIPLKETEDGYEIQLPDKAWANIVDCQTIAYQHVDANAADCPKNAVSRYIGSDYIAGVDAGGHPMIDADGYWTYVGDQLICYEAKPAKETDEGIVYNGQVKARLNDVDDIILLVEWNPVKGDEEPETGHIVGYTMADDDNIIDTKGSLTLEAGDAIQFLFDYYDAEGNLIATQPQGDVIHVSKQERIVIEYKPIESGIIDFGGVLTDVYQRVMTTEMIEGEV